MEIHILLKGEHLGPFSENQVRQYLGEGIVSPSDLATYEGMEDWQSLDHILTNLATSAEPATLEVEVLPPNVPLTPPDTLGPVFPDTEPSPSAMHEDEAQFLEVESSPASNPPEAESKEPELPLTASQKTKKKINKIVIQPIFPQENTAPAPAQKKKTTKTALTLEPFRPTTALPPVSGFAPREKKSTKAPMRTGPVALRNLPEQPAAPVAPVAEIAVPSPKPTAPPLPVAPTPEPEPEPAPVAVREIKSEPYVVPDIRKQSVLEEPWYQTLPKEVVFIGIALGILAISLIATAIYLVSLFFHSPTTPSITDSPIIAPPSQIDIQSSDVGPKTASDYADRGLSRQSKGDIDGALEDYNQAISLDPKNALAYYRRGLALQSKNDLDAAVSDYTQAIAFDSKQANAYSNRAFIKQSKGDLDGALADYDHSLALNPKIAVAYYNEGLIKVQKGNLDGAIDSYNRALDLDPQMAIAYYNRGVAKNTEGNLEGAIADYTQALNFNPNIARAYCDRGFARQAKGDLDGAITDYGHALTLNPKMAAAFYNRGLVKMQQGDLDSALADYNQSIELSPKNELAYFNRGMAEFGKGNQIEALSDLNKYVEMAPPGGQRRYGAPFISG